MKTGFYGSNELDINIRINLSFYDFKSPSMSDSDLQRGFPDNQNMKMHFRNYQIVTTEVSGRTEGTSKWYYEEDLLAGYISTINNHIINIRNGFMSCDNFPAGLLCLVPVSHRQERQVLLSAEYQTSDW